LIDNRTLRLYRRHRKECEAGHPEDFRSGQFEEGRRGWKKCGCQIHASGTLNGQFRRKYTGKTDWDEAKAVAAHWEKANAWDGVPALPSPLPARSSSRITITEAAEVFLTHREGANIAPATLRKYRTFIRQLTHFADTRGYVMLDQFTPSDIDVFYSEWNLGARTKGKRLGTLRSFFRFTHNRKWLAENPVSTDIKPPIGASRVANKAPYTDEELQRIIDACDRLGHVKWSNYSGEDVKDFVWLMIYSGLRISDAALFNINRLKGNEVFLRAKKNGGEVFAFMPDWLVNRLNSRAKRLGDQPFLMGGSDRLETVTDMWRRKLRKVFALAGEFEEPPTAHRFRHSFARILLQRGVPVADVADLLGDNEKTVREHYSRWVPERQLRLTRILKEAFADKPKPKLIAMPGRGT
jgi:integrase